MLKEKAERDYSENGLSGITLEKKVSGMELLKAKVVDQIIKVSASTYRSTTFLLRLRPDFKYAIVKYCRKNDLSIAKMIRRALADKIGWDGDL